MGNAKSTPLQSSQTRREAAATTVTDGDDFASSKRKANQIISPTAFNGGMSMATSNIWLPSFNMNSNASSSEDSRAKRQRIAPMQAAVHHLSAAMWCDVADFLPKTSRALLAVALTAPPASFRESGWKGQPNAISRAIIAKTKTGVLTDELVDGLCGEEGWDEHHCPKRTISIDYVYGQSAHVHSFIFRNDLSKQIKQYYDSQWEMMDFVDIPKSLALRLTDDDVGAVLVCIDAANNLNRLKLTNCFNVVGTCLEPLRRSTVLEYVDLELVRQFEKPWHHCATSYDGTECDEIKLCEGTVFDVLGGILREDGNSLKRLQYPYKWYYDPPAESGLFGGSNRIWEGRYQTMSGRCNQFVNDHNAVVNKFAYSLYFNENAQSVCARLNENRHDEANMCIFCGEKYFYSFCAHCNEILCTDCSTTNECRVCNVRYCLPCSRESGFETKVTLCSEYCQRLCSLCRLDICKNTPNACVECKKLTFDTLLEECNSKKAQIDALRLEIESMRQSSNGTSAGA